MEKKKVLIISPQHWNFLFISKQHYALELSGQYEVYYLSFPEKKMGTGFSITKDPYSGRVHLLNYKVPLPHRLMFKATPLYKWMNKRTIRKVLQKITGNQPFDLVIDFGLFFLYDDLTWVNARKKVFFPVDDALGLPVNYKGANLVLSVSQNIVDKFRQHNVPAHFIHHGLSVEYASLAEKRLQEPDLGIKTTWNEPVKVGYIGNLDNDFVDRAVMLQVMQETPSCRFHIYGWAPDQKKHATSAFWQQLLALNNVQFHGKQSPSELAQKIQDMDVLLLCYKPDYKRYHAENSHKIMEYLSTGKPVVSTCISIFEHTGLLYMTPKDKNEELLSLLQQVTKQPSLYSNAAEAEKRIRFALEHTYARHAEQLIQLAELNH